MRGNSCRGAQNSSHKKIAVSQMTGDIQMTVRHKSIPTLYKNVMFRSRLEARWASIFIMFGWKWDYEPFDLDGWIPDFVITGHDRLFVEIKPTELFLPDIADKML